MTLADDLAVDYLHDERAEAVTHTAIPEDSETADVQAFGDDPSFREITLGPEIGLEPVETVWVLWATTLDAVVPKQGDTITDSGGDVWVILWLKKIGNPADPSKTLQWRCGCRKQVS